MAKSVSTTLFTPPTIPEFCFAQIRKKLVLVGDGWCGKTTMAATYIYGDPFSYGPVCMDVRVSDVHVEGKRLELEIWDTLHHEEYERLRPLSYFGADVFILTFAIDELRSFRNVTDKWIPELRHFNPHTPILLVGCKSDTSFSSGRSACCVRTTDAEDMAATIGACGYFTCSAYDRDSVNVVFKMAAKLSLAAKQ